MKIFAQRIKELRNEKKLKQVEIAAIFGISTRQYQNYEGAINYPDVAGLIKIADFFGVTTDYLLGRSDSRT